MNQWINPFKPQSAILNLQSPFRRLLGFQSAIGNPQSSIAILLTSDSFPLPYQSAIQNRKSKIRTPRCPKIRG
jgi:hypothetical protein